MRNNKTLKLFVKISQQRMYHHYLPKLIQAVQELNSEQLWSREVPNLNTIGGIILHICEHVRRNSLRFSNQNPVAFHTGIEKYFPDSNLSHQELLGLVKEAFNILITKNKG